MNRRNFLKAVAALAAMPSIAVEQSAPLANPQPTTHLYSIIYNGVAIGIAEGFSITKESDALYLTDELLPPSVPTLHAKAEITYVSNIDTGFLKPFDTGMLHITSSNFKPVFANEMTVAECALIHHEGKFAQFHTKFFNQFA